MIQAIAISILFILWRFLLAFDSGWLPNFVPIVGLSVVGGLILPRKWGLWVPLVIMVLSDFLLNTFVYSWDPLTRIEVYGLVFLFSWLTREFNQQRNGWVWMGMTFLMTVVFYLFTNTQMWALSGQYDISLLGYIQCMVLGLPGYPPTWTFFRNALLANHLFVGLVILCSNSQGTFSWNPRLRRCLP